jgi:hypothetical protein
MANCSSSSVLVWNPKGLYRFYYDTLERQNSRSGSIIEPVSAKKSFPGFQTRTAYRYLPRGIQKQQQIAALTVISTTLPRAVPFGPWPDYRDASPASFTRIDCHD